MHDSNAFVSVVAQPWPTIAATPPAGASTEVTDFHARLPLLFTAMSNTRQPCRRSIPDMYGLPPLSSRRLSMLFCSQHSRHKLGPSISGISLGRWCRWVLVAVGGSTRDPSVAALVRVLSQRRQNNLEPKLYSGCACPNRIDTQMLHPSPTKGGAAKPQPKSTPQYAFLLYRPPPTHGAHTDVITECRPVGR